MRPQAVTTGESSRIFLHCRWSAASSPIPAWPAPKQRSVALRSLDTRSGLPANHPGTWSPQAFLRIGARGSEAPTARRPAHLTRARARHAALRLAGVAPRQLTLIAAEPLRCERVGGGEAGGADRGEDAGDRADQDRGADAAAPGERGDDGRPVLGVRVDRGGERARADAGGAAEQGEEDRLGEELGADLARVAPSARRRPISERRSRTLMIMMFATPIAPTSRATAPRPRKRPLNAPLASASAVERRRRVG